MNNAGVGMIGPLECQSIDAMKELFDTNFFGLARLVRELLPDMKRRRSGHIVVMSSVMGTQGAFVIVAEMTRKLAKRKEGYSDRFLYVLTQGLLFNDVYSASKFAVEGFCESLAVQAMKFNIK